MSANPLPKYRLSCWVSTRQPSHRREPTFAVCEEGFAPMRTRPLLLLTCLIRSLMYCTSTSVLMSGYWCTV
jgi:hypothetical protein